MKSLVTGLALIISFTSFSQNDAKAKALLNEVSTKVKSYDNISIDFKYVLTNLSENINQETRGSVVMQGNKYKLDILGITRIYDGRTLYSISPEDEEVTISKEDGSDPNSITPNKMLFRFMKMASPIKWIFSKM